MLWNTSFPYFHFHLLPNDFRALLVLFFIPFFSFSRDRSIPELDDILDSKLSEVQDHMRALMQKQVYDYLHLPCLLCPVLTRAASTSISIRVSMSQAYAWAWEAYALEQGRPWPTRWSEDDLDTRQYIRYSCVHPYAYFPSLPPRPVLTNVEAPYAHDYLAQ